MGKDSDLLPIRIGSHDDKSFLESIYSLLNIVEEL